MLSYSQINAMLKVHNRGDNPLSTLPVELISTISEFGQNPGSDFDKAINHVARGKDWEVKTILDKASKKEDKTELKELLLSSGTVTTRCGLVVKHKTLLECALGEGDPKMIKMIKSYFPKFTNGEEEMEKQIERYRPCIFAMQNQKPDDLTGLFDIILKSSDKDVAAELAMGDEYDVNHQSELRTALNTFREQKLDPKVRVITKPRMHYNYQNLIHAYDMLHKLTKSLKKQGGDKHKRKNKLLLVAQQIIGFIQLVEVPGDEFALSSFPDFDASRIKSHSGFWIDYYSSIKEHNEIKEAAFFIVESTKLGLQKRISKKFKRKTSDLQMCCSAIGELAGSFKDWLIDYGIGSDNQKLVDWLWHGFGAKHVKDYRQFCELAILLHQNGYATNPPPIESEFNKGMERYAKFNKPRVENIQWDWGKREDELFGKRTRPTSFEWPIDSLAERFHRWMNEDDDHNLSHNKKLLEWLYCFGEEVTNYKKFCLLAAYLHHKGGYETFPPPSESKFNEVKHAKRAPNLFKPLSSIVGIDKNQSSSGIKQNSNYQSTVPLSQNNKINTLLKKYSLPDASQPSLEKGLRNAVTNNNIDDLKIFISVVQNINAKDTNPTVGRTALHWAAFKEHRECCKLLLRAGAKPDIPDAKGQTALYMYSSLVNRNRF